MSKEILGQLRFEGKQLSLEEVLPTAASVEEFVVGLRLEDASMDLDLDGIRKLKRILCEGERRLQDRHRQAMKRRNMEFNF